MNEINDFQFELRQGLLKALKEYGSEPDKFICVTDRLTQKYTRAIMDKIKEEEKKNIKYVSGNDGYIGSINLSKKGKL
jgi:hypothetical protein